MEMFQPILDAIDNETHRNKLKEVLTWIHEQYLSLTGKIMWNQPMFIHGKTFIIGFSVSKHHLAFSPEKACIDHFEKAIEASGYKRTKMLVQIKWNQPIDYELLGRIIDHNIKEKAGSDHFWRSE